MDNEDELLSWIKMRAMKLMHREDERGDQRFLCETEAEITQVKTEAVQYQVEKKKELPPIKEARVLEPTHNVPVQQKEKNTVKHQKQMITHEQISIFPSNDDFFDAIRNAGFTCVDNREVSGILWVIYDGEKSDVFHAIEQKYSFKASLERRGAVATKGVPAWRILI